jgi:hypothetical protein
MIRDRRVLAFFALIVLAAIWIRWWASSDYILEGQICETYDPQKNCDGYNIFFYSAWLLGKAVDRWSALITAVATGVIGLFTYTLYKATTGMVEAAEIQSADMKRSIVAAEMAAKASKKSAETAETALLVQHRPIITITGLDLRRSDDMFEKPHVNWEMRNSGNALAVVTDVVVKTGIVGEGGFTKNSRAHNAWLGAIEPGEGSGGLKTSTTTIQTRFDDILSGDLKLFMQIELQLMDVMHNRSSAKFPFIYNSEKNSFERSGLMIEGQEKDS